MCPVTTVQTTVFFYICRGMEKAAEVLQTGLNGRQKNVILITDEKSTSSGTKEAADALRAQGATVYAVGVGDLHGAHEELTGISGRKDRVFVKEIHHFNAEFGKELGSRVCGAVAHGRRFW